MGNSPITVGIRTQKLEYKAGDTVHGTVYLNITKRNQSAQALVLQLVGRETAVVHYTTSETHRDGDTEHTRHHDHYDESTYDFMRIEYPLHKFLSQQLVPGQFEFPFSIQLPMDLPSSMQCQKGQSRCSVEYRVTATLMQPSSGIFSSNPSSEQLLTVFRISPLHEDPSNCSLELPVQEVPVVACCCHNKGSITLQAQFSRTILQPRDKIEVQFRCRNDSSVRVHHVRVGLQQTTQWTTSRGRTETVSDVLDRRELDAKIFPELQKRQRRPKYGLGTVNEQVPFQDSNWNRCTIQVPATVRDSHDGRAIKVRHLITVQLLTDGCCTTDPDAATMVSIYHNLVVPPAAATIQQVADSLPNSESPYKDGLGYYDGPSTTSYTEHTTVPPPPSAPVSQWDTTNAHYSGEVTPMAEAHALPPDWNAQTAEVVHIPMAEAVVLEGATSWNFS